MPKTSALTRLNRQIDTYRKNRDASRARNAETAKIKAETGRTKAISKQIKAEAKSTVIRAKTEKPVERIKQQGKTARTTAIASNITATLTPLTAGIGQGVRERLSAGAHQTSITSGSDPYSQLNGGTATKGPNASDTDESTENEDANRRLK